MLWAPLSPAAFFCLPSLGVLTISASRHSAWKMQDTLVVALTFLFVCVTVVVDPFRLLVRRVYCCSHGNIFYSFFYQVLLIFQLAPVAPGNYLTISPCFVFSLLALPPTSPPPFPSHPHRSHMVCRVVLMCTSLSFTHGCIFATSFALVLFSFC